MSRGTSETERNGKTSFGAALGLFFTLILGARTNLNSAQSLRTAKESTERAIEMLESAPDHTLWDRFGKYYRTNGQERIEFEKPRAVWKVLASTQRAGRGESVDGLLLLDEIRAMFDADKNGWSSLSKTTMAQRSPLTLCISNAGSSESTVLNSLQDKGREAAGDPTYRGQLGLFEWSAPDGLALTNTDGWRAANPALGHLMRPEAIEDALLTDPPAVFRVEILCQRVISLADMAVPEGTWASCMDPGLRLESFDRDTMTVGLDASPDAAHASLVAASLGDDGRTRIALVASWAGTTKMLEELPALLEEIAPAGWAWSSVGPLAACASDLRSIGDAVGGMREVTGKRVTESCQEFGQKAASGRILHAGEPMLIDHVTKAKRWPQQDGGWRVVRKGAGHVDGFYASALATWLAAQDVRPRIQLFA